MIRPQLRIPQVAFASLVAGAGGSGCSSSSSIADDLADAICRTYQNCQPVDFAYDYASLDDCRSLKGALFDFYYDYYTASDGRSCARALFAYELCYYTYLDATMCLYDPTGVQCLDELYAYYDACN